MNKLDNDTLPSTLDQDMGFAAPHDVPVPYMQRTRTYYAALGYPRPYRWAQFVDVPFTPLAKPLAECRVALVTTAAPYQPDKGDQGPGAPYNSAAKFYRVYSVPVDPAPDLRISHVGIDRAHTTAEDPRAWLPLAQMQRAEAQGRIGALAARLRRASTACPPTAATARPLTRTAPTCWCGSARTGPRPWSCSQIARSATSRSALPPGISRRTGSRR